MTGAHHFTIGQVATVVVLAGSIAASFVLTQAKASDNGERLTKVEEVQAQIARTAFAHAKQLRDQAKGLNWIGEAVQAIADKNRVRLPPRPIVNEALPAAVTEPAPTGG